MRSRRRHTIKHRNITKTVNLDKRLLSEQVARDDLLAARPMVNISMTILAEVKMGFRINCGSCCQQLEALKPLVDAVSRTTH